MARRVKRRHGPWSWRRLLTALEDREVVHVLHIGKTGGTAVADAFARLDADPRTPVRFEKHGHKVARRDLPAGAPFVFAVRDPIRRFYSGFYSRKRKGRPRIHAEWSRQEAAAFAEFPHAEDLASSLFAAGLRGARAVDAMRAIGHVRNFQLEWFDDLEALFTYDRPLMVLRQEHLARDFGVLMDIIGVAGRTTLPTDDVRAHRNDYRDCPPLSVTARDNLARWYAADLAFVAMANEWVERRSVATGALRPAPRRSATDGAHADDEGTLDR